MWKIIDICRTCRIHPVRRIKKTLRTKKCELWKEDLDLPLLYWIYKMQKLLILHEYLGSPPGFDGIPCCLLVFCLVFFVLFVFFLCLVHPMLTVYLECQFLIALRFSLTVICTRVRTHTDVLPSLPNVLRSLCPNYQHLFYLLSNPLHNHSPLKTKTE